jgi:hypothetical protein
LCDICSREESPGEPGRFAVLSVSGEGAGAVRRGFAGGIQIDACGACAGALAQWLVDRREAATQPPAPPVEAPAHEPPAGEPEAASA